jgi:DnaJ-class molecular chaperone
MSGNICFICNSYHDTTACPQASYSVPQREWQRCPVCDGRGTDPFAGLSNTSDPTCPHCSGARVVERPR